jgi:transcriptional regulator with XRE-family HTH domain
MGYGHAHHIIATAAAAGTPAPSTRPPIDPALYQRDDMREVLAVRDVTALYLALKAAGLTQRQIAELTGQSQPEVSDILAGRRVSSYDVLVRIAGGLRIPRELMGLSFGAAYGGDVTVAEPPRGVSAEMLRRHLIALGAVAAVGGATIGELLGELPVPASAPLPSRVGAVHVEKIRDLTRQLREAGRAHGSDPELGTSATAWASRLLDVPGTEQVTRALKAAVSELHIQAGWAGTDAGLHERAMWHYARGLKLATDAGDVYLEALALNYAGLSVEEHGYPNDGLKLLQLGLHTARGIPPSRELRAPVEAVAHENAATAYARLGYPQAADRELGRARELWSPENRSGDPNQVAACLELERGRLDVAEPFVHASMRRWEGVSRRAHIQSGVLLATIHVRAGEPRGLALAHSAVTAASKLTSVRTRKRLEPLYVALEARSGSDAEQLARMTRQVATTRV